VDHRAMKLKPKHASENGRVHSLPYIRVFVNFYDVIIYVMNVPNILEKTQDPKTSIKIPQRTP